MNYLIQVIKEKMVSALPAYIQHYPHRNQYLQ